MGPMAGNTVDDGITIIGKDIAHRNNHYPACYPVSGHRRQGQIGAVSPIVMIFAVSGKIIHVKIGRVAQPGGCGLNPDVRAQIAGAGVEIAMALGAEVVDAFHRIACDRRRIGLPVKPKVLIMLSRAGSIFPVRGLLADNAVQETEALGRGCAVDGRVVGVV